MIILLSRVPTGGVSTSLTDRVRIVYDIEGDRRGQC
jgi:hypothetical protein